MKMTMKEFMIATQILDGATLYSGKKSIDFVDRMIAKHKWLKRAIVHIARTRANS